jgi:RNA polymerase sigma factor (sigma-70 family)
MSQINDFGKDLASQWEYWYPRVYGYFYKRVGLEAEVDDLTANTMNAAFTAKDVQNFQGYIWRVAHNHLVKYINTKNTDPTPLSLNEDWIAAEYQPKAEEQISNRYSEKLVQLNECIKNHIKDSEEQNLLDLSIFQEKNSTEISQITGLKADNIRQKLSRILKRLREKCVHLWPESGKFSSSKLL